MIVLKLFGACTGSQRVVFFKKSTTFLLNDGWTYVADARALSLAETPLEVTHFIPENNR
jgi:hypothetical protein